MRQILILFAVFLAGILLGHDFWPRAHSDPAYHFRFHRGKMPYLGETQPATPTPTPSLHHGRVLRMPGAE